METLLPLLVEAPPVIVVGALWIWHSRLNNLESKRLHDRIARKDAQLDELADGLEKLVIGLELLKDRLPRHPTQL